MRLPAILLLLIFCWDKSLSNDFIGRSATEWRNAWHTERHRRCYRELISHMDTVCSNDIYKVARRSEPPHRTKDMMDSSFEELMKRSGHLRRVKRGIMDECCSDHGCSWEEYAEYCPTNRRVRTKK